MPTCMKNWQEMLPDLFSDRLHPPRRDVLFLRCPCSSRLLSLLPRGIILHCREKLSSNLLSLYPQGIPVFRDIASESELAVPADCPVT